MSPRPVMVSNREEDSMNTEPSLSGKAIIGLIFPPPEIRTIVDKTAAFVARNGIDFENKIREKEAANSRFNFLSATDPYNAYYQHKVREFQDGTPLESTTQRPGVPEAVKEHVKQAEFIPTEPPPEFEFSADPATINAFDLDLIKLTALFVARNGRQFLTQLMNREIRNYQFDFLKPQHSNFAYFTKLVEQYTKVIIPPKTIVADLKAELGNQKKLMDRVQYRVAWQRQQRRLKEAEEAEAEKERVSYAQIEWHDFVVVQTVDFPQHDTGQLPPLCTPKDVGARILQQARVDAAKAATQTVEMDMESDSDEETDNRNDEAPPPMATTRPVYEVTQPTPAPPSIQNVVVKDYDPKRARPELSKKADKWLVSPLTGERVPADKLQDHVRFNMVDSQYMEQRGREQLALSEEEPILATGADVERHISEFAKRRSDIFGVGAQGAEQTIIGQKLGEEEVQRGPDPKTIWDGQQATIDATTRAAQASVTIDQQIAEIHKAQGYTPNKERIGVVQPPSLPTTGAAIVPPPVVRPPPPAIIPRPPVPMAMRPPMSQSNFIAAAFPTGGAVRPLIPVPSMAQPVIPLIPPMGLAMPGIMPALSVPVPLMQQMSSHGGSSHGGLSHGGLSHGGSSHGGLSHGDGPPAKRARTEEDLEPENVWLSKVNGIINLKVQTPSSTEWTLDGGTISIPIDMTDTITSLKNMIQDKLGVPAPKQKLVLEGFFLKDTASLAFYNMNSSSIVHLQMKERGGRKK